MRGALFRNLSLFSRSRHFSLYLRPSSTPLLSNVYTNFPRKIHSADNARPLYFFPSQMRFFSSDNGTKDPDSNLESEPAVAAPEEKEPAEVEVEDVNNKELKTQLDDYLTNCNEESLPTIFESVLKRRLSEKHEETDDELMDELELMPLDNVNDEAIESDFEEGHKTDDEIEDLYNARETVERRMQSDPFYNMNDHMWNDMMKESTDLGYLQNMRECEEILTDMLHYDKLLPDEIKRKVEVKYNEISDRIEKGEIEAEEGYEIFKEFEDQIVLECMKLMEAKGPTEEKINVDPPSGEGPILRWRTRLVISPGGDQWHPKNRKVKLSVTVKELGLNKFQFVRLREMAGKRYNPGKDELTVTSQRFEHREENRKDCYRTLLALIEEAVNAEKMVHEARVLEMKERLKANPEFMQRLLSKKKTLTSVPATAS